MEVQKCWCAYSVFMHRLLRKSQTRMVLSSLAETRYLPPGWNARPRTQLSWPLSVSRQRPTLTSQMRMVLSREPEARNGPWWWPFLLSAPAASFIAEAAASGAQAMHSTVCSWSRNSTCRIDNQTKVRLHRQLRLYLAVLTLQSFEFVNQTRIVWSFEHVAKMLPSMCTRTIRTHSLWPV